MSESVKPKISKLFIYPIKSCAGVELKEMKIADCGPMWDRHWLIVDEKGDKITQRQFPMMSQIYLEILDFEIGLFKLSFADKEPITIQAGASFKNKIMQVKVWGEDLQAYQSSVDISLWLSDIFKQKVFLVENKKELTKRKVGKKYGDSFVGFADQFPLLLIGTASLDYLQEQLLIKIAPQHFRPNLVIETQEKHIEDSWREFRINNISFKGVKHCSRCQVVNIDPTTGQSSPQTLKALMKYRRTEKGILFGENLIHLNNGTIKIGDHLTI